MNASVELLLVGEAWDEEEQRLSRRLGIPCPFVGKSGFLLYRNLWQVGALRNSNPPPLHWPGPSRQEALWQLEAPRILRSNVIQARPGPDSNDFSLLGGDKKKLDPGLLCLDRAPLKLGKYLLRQHEHHILQLEQEITTLQPNLVVALGSNALWGLTDDKNISNARGNIRLLGQQKLLPVNRPAAIFCNWTILPKFKVDCQKIEHEMQSPAFDQKPRWIEFKPNIGDLWSWWFRHGQRSELLSIDVETEKMQYVSEFGIGADEQHALHIPLILKDGKHYSSYWPDVKTEVKAWQFIRHVCASPIPKIGQNITYDIQYLLWTMECPLWNVQHDTMLHHHALYPEMEKSLGFMASYLCNEPQWKQLRRTSNKDDE